MAENTEKKKGFLARMIEKLDKKMEQKAQKASCCNKDEKGKGGSCC